MDLERSEFLFRVWTLSAAAVTVAVTILLLFAVLSPDISLDLPGISRCQGGECFNGGD
ncbi:MAG: hypothetical protein ACRDZ3_05160 [Acidimicrobiia bacterium]